MTEQAEYGKVVLAILGEQHWPRLAVRGLYRYEHAGFKGAFVPGAPVTLEREHDNAKDTNAVRVILSDGEMLGYIAKEAAPLISSELAKGVKFVTRIARTAFLESKWGQCELDVYRKVSQESFEKLEMISRVNQNKSIAYDSHGSVTYASTQRTSLCDAVVQNDVAQARESIAHGGDVDEMTFKLQVNRPYAGYCSQPLLSKIRSLEMYKLFVEAGAETHPKSYILDNGGGAPAVGCWLPSAKIYGQEHNLLEELWRGPEMDEKAVELADYLVFSEYDMSLRSKINEIRESCERKDGNCPYEKNKAYVLEWCDMEKRAFDAFSKYLDSLHEYSPYSLGHDLTIFFCDWKAEGYNYACGNPEVGKDERPPRYVYPERILKRGFKVTGTSRSDKRQDGSEKK